MCVSRFVTFCHGCSFKLSFNGEICHVLSRFVTVRFLRFKSRFCWQWNKTYPKTTAWHHRSFDKLWFTDNINQGSRKVLANQIFEATIIIRCFFIFEFHCHLTWRIRRCVIFSMSVDKRSDLTSWWLLWTASTCRIVAGNSDTTRMDFWVSRGIWYRRCKQERKL